MAALFVPLASMDRQPALFQVHEAIDRTIESELRPDA